MIATWDELSVKQIVLPLTSKQSIISFYLSNPTMNVLCSVGLFLEDDCLITESDLLIDKSFLASEDIELLAYRAKMCLENIQTICKKHKQQYFDVYEWNHAQKL